MIGHKQDLEFTNKLLVTAKDILSDSNNLTNTWGYKSTYGNISLVDKLDYVKDYIIEFGKEYLQHSLAITEGLKLDVEIFFSEMKEGDCHKIHAHPNCLLSGVIYLDVPDNSASINFYDSRNHYDFVGLKTVNNIDLSIYTIPPKTGLILIWPAWIKHEVPLNKVNGRITAVFNIVQNF